MLHPQFAESWERITQEILLPLGCASCEQQAAEAAQLNSRAGKQQRSCGRAPTAAAVLLILPRVPRSLRAQHKPVTPETQQQRQHHLLPVHLYPTLRGCEH